MAFIPLLLLVFIIFLVVKRQELGFLRHRHYIILGLLSLAWWAFLFIDQLGRKSLGCPPDDELCNSGNTFWGDFTWSTLLAIFSLTLVWVPAVVTSFYFQKRQRRHTDKK